MAQKLYELTFEERSGYLFARLKSDIITRDIAIDYLQDLGMKCDELQVSHLLMVRDIPEMLSPASADITTEKAAQFLQGIRTAFVNPHPAIHEDLELAITKSRNHGAQFSLHNCFEDAEEWLLDLDDQRA